MKRIIIFAYLIVNIILINAQTTISGYIYDAQTKETIIGATVLDTLNILATATNTQGYFSLRTNSDKLKIASIGYIPQTVEIVQNKDTLINIYLKKSVFQLQEIIISGQNSDPINTPQLSIQEITEIPSLTGQPDVIKSTKILPGIQTQNEASNLLIVRGGDPGQNMFLLDNTTLIYVNHLGGFMSVFNPDIINNIKIYKGSFPPKYGGKLSSIINITQRTGNPVKFKGSFGIGITDINLSIEGKLSEKSTYIFNARKTLFDPLLYLATYLSEGGDYNMYYGFHDINLKISHKINDKNKISFNCFQGDDYINVRNKKNTEELKNTDVKYKNVWGNYLISSSLNSIIGYKIFGNTTLAFTRYRVKNVQDYNDLSKKHFKNNFIANVNDYSLNSVWSLNILNNWKIDAGIHSSFIYNIPYKYTVSGKFNGNTKVSDHIWNNAISVNNKLNLSKTINLNLGTRLSNYNYSKTTELIIEPRIDLNFKLKKIGNINLNYMHVSQAMHLLVTTGAIYTNEIWLPAAKNIPVSKSKQISATWSKSFYKNMFKLSIGIYQKNMTDLITAKENFYDLHELENWKNTIETNGTGQAKGIEIMLKKNHGKFTGIITYHLSNSNRQFERINNGETYNYEYNRPHDISVFVNRKLNKKWSCSITWYYQSGLPYTPVLGRQMAINNDDYDNYYEALIYDKRNSAKMKPYHRLDLGISYKTTTKKQKLPYNVTLSIYNVYNRHNPNYYYYNNNNSNIMHSPKNGFEKLNLYQISLFSIIPSISYKVYFNNTNFKKISFKKWLYYEN